nr:retrovirus-related Pol polyprotein from transposon TNT 1-94 [Tanacetum cinerariifolium]
GYSNGGEIQLDEDREGKLLIHHIIVARPTEKHVHAVKRIFRYFRGTVHRGIWYPKDSSVALTAFVDADHAGCQDTRRSTSGRTDLDGSSRTDLDGPLGTDLVGSSGTDLDGSLRTDLVSSSRTDLDGSLETDLNRCPFFKAFLVTADVPEIYMQKFWATTYLHQHSIRFKMKNKKHIVNLESFRDMLHICPRIPGNLLMSYPLKRRFWISLDFVYRVAHKNHKKSNEMYYPRFTKVIIHHFMSKDPSIPRRNKVNWHYVRDDFLFSMIKAYKEYYAFAAGEAAPKPKANARRKRSDSDTSITPPTATVTLKPTVAATPRLTVAAKGKQPAKATKAKSPSALSEVAITEVEQLKLVLKRNRQQMHISQSGGSGTDEGTGGGDDEEECESDEEDDNEETRDEESFDPIPKTPESSKDEGDSEEDQGLNVNEEEHVEEEEEDKLYRDVNIYLGRGLQANLKVEDSHVTLTPVNPDGQQESSSVSSQFVTSMLNPTSDVGMESIFTTASSSVAPLPTSTPIMTPSTIASITTISQAPIHPTPIPGEVLQNLPTFASVFRFDDRLKSLEANFSEFRQINLFAEAVSAILDRQRNLYKALVDAYEADKVILESYGETVILKKRRVDDDDKDEGPSAGSDRGSKRRREGKDHESTSAPLETTTRSACRSTTGSTSRQASGSESAFAEEPVQTTSQIEEPSHPPQKPPTPDRDWNKTLPAVQESTQIWIRELAKQADPRSSFNELLDTPLDFSTFIMNRLRVDTLTPKLLAGPTYDLMKGSCKSLIELEYHLEEVYKATTDQLDWVNPEDYRHIKWIKDLVPSTMWIQEPIDYDKHALWGVSHWGRKRQQFYGFAVNRESARDVYSKRRIIALSNLTVEERFAFNVSLRMFTRSIVIQRRVEDLQLGVESYQKRLNLTKPDTYQSDLKRREAYTAYSNPRRFIYQNKDKKNRLMRIDELHKFSDGTLNDVRIALDDRLKGLGCSIWHKKSGEKVIRTEQRP